MKKRPKIFVNIIFLLGMFFLALSAGYFFTVYKKVVVEKTNKNLVSPAPTPTPDPLRIRNILLLGYAGGSHDGATLTDTIILARIYPKDEKILLISIPRDLWVPIPISKNDIQYFKINHAFAIGLDDKKFPDKAEEYKGIYGAGSLVRQVASVATGITPENFIAINFSGFTSIVDNLGGIEVNVPYSFEDKFYPIEGLENDTCGRDENEMKLLTATMSGDLLEKTFTCRYETLEFEKGKSVLDGETALKFVRSRHSEINGNDFGRSLRQQAFLIGVKNKFLKIGSVPKIITLINTLSKNVITDIDFKTAFQIISEQETLSDFKVETLTLTTDNVLMESISSDRQYILISKDGEGKFDSIQKFIQENI